MAGNATATFAQQFTLGGITASIQTNKAQPGVAVYSGQIPANTTDQPINIQFKHADVVWYNLQSDQNVTLNVNNVSAGAPSIALVAGVPQTYLGSGTQLFSADVTAIHGITGNIPANANVIIQVLLDSSNT